MARRLTAYVHLRDENGVLCSYGPSDTVPAWAAKQITNPDAWEGQDDATSPEPAEDAPAPAADLAAGPNGTSDGEPAPEEDAPAVAPPPKGGAGSGRDAWAAYAEAMGFDVEDDDTREAIIAGLEEAGIATEVADPAE